MKFNREGKTYTVVFTISVTFLFVLILSGLNTFTAGMVKKNQELFKIKAILNAVGIQYVSDEEAIEKFKSSVIKEDVKEYELYKSVVDGEEIYTIIFSGSGLWGTITGALAVNKDVSKIVGIDFISQNETPGLGGRIEEDWFKRQFENESIKNGIIVSTTKVPDSKEDGMVDAITGATLTSKSIENIIRNYIPILRNLLGVN
ncbi:MAG: FMN-binding protein [Fervidobacterium sp.]|nr:FMN-binding protein [Fervidobacterium sp.]